MTNTIITDSDTQLPRLRVKLPPELVEMSATTGYHPSTPDEDRIQARLNVHRESAIEFVYTPLALLEEICERPRLGIGLLKDMSKEGAAILYHEQLYPGERAKIHVQGRVLTVTVQRCRRVAEMCYEAGVRVDCVESK